MHRWTDQEADASHRQASPVPRSPRWLLDYLRANGSTRKDQVLADWLKANPGPSASRVKAMEVTFGRYRARGLVTGRRRVFQGWSWWRLTEAGEKVMAPRYTRPVVSPKGRYRPPWGSGRQAGRMQDWTEGRD